MYTYTHKDWLDSLGKLFWSNKNQESGVQDNIFQIKNSLCHFLKYDSRKNRV